MFSSSKVSPIIANIIATNKVATKVDKIMPPIMPVPMAWRLPAPAPVEMASGKTPKVNASEVITIGRKRSLAALTAASA